MNFINVLDTEGKTICINLDRVSMITGDDNGTLFIFEGSRLPVGSKASMEEVQKCLDRMVHSCRRVRIDKGETLNVKVVNR